MPDVPRSLATLVARFDPSAFDGPNGPVRLRIAVRDAPSWDVLADHGNQSSASVLFVLGETLGRGVPAGYGLLAAFGPGITVELALLRGQPC